MILLRNFTKVNLRLLCGEFHVRMKCISRANEANSTHE